MTDYPFVPARHFTAASGRTIDLIVLHTPEAPIGGRTAENVAHYFATTDRAASTHLVSDTDSVVRCVLDKDVAYGAKGANRSGLHIEVGGYTRTTAAAWASADGLAELEVAAGAVARWCAAYGIAPRFLDAADLQAGRRQGVTTHYEVNRAWPSTGHTDPGPAFPLATFLARVAARLAPAPAPVHQEDDVPTIFTTPDGKALVVLDPASTRLQPVTTGDAWGALLALGVPYRNGGRPTEAQWAALRAQSKAAGGWG